MFAGHELNISKTVKAKGAGVFLKVDFLIRLNKRSSLSNVWKQKKFLSIDS